MLMVEKQRRTIRR